jgi:AcrR family transcriptional regulator
VVHPAQLESEVLAGRPREFDSETVLNAAMAVFWRKGFEGATISDLEQATGLQRSSIHGAYGNKEALFLLALERYNARYCCYISAAMKLPTSREVAAHLLQGVVELCTRYADRTGCFDINGALATSDGAEPVRQALIKTRAVGEVRLRERFDQAKTVGDLPKSIDTSVLAAYLMAVNHGIAVQAKAGFPRILLESIAALTLAGWPSGR